MSEQPASHQNITAYSSLHGLLPNEFHHESDDQDSKFATGPTSSKNEFFENSEEVKDSIEPDKGNVSRDAKHLTGELLPGADNRHSVDQFNCLAQKAIGIGDYAAAFKFRREAALLNCARSKVRLGFMSSAGEGVEKDDEEAVYWFREAAEQGEPRGQYMLGLRYFYGLKGVHKDEARAVCWLQESAAQGHLPAILQLGKVYESGFGVTQDFAKAAKLIALAFRCGCLEAKIAMELSSDCYTKQLRIEMQRILKIAGVYFGALDGCFGEATIAALKNYRENYTNSIFVAKGG